MTNKERYCEWAASQEYVPVFMMPWWLDAVCAGKTWDVLLAEDEGGHILGAMPYMLRGRAFYKFISMPPQTQTGGIWVTPEVTADKWRTAEACRQIKEQMETLGIAYYYQQYLPGSLCVDAMRGLGCKVKERTVYRVEDLSNLDALIASFSKNKQKQLQKSLSLHAEHKMDIEDFYRFYCRCMSNAKRRCAYTREFLLVLERKAKRLGQCEVLNICNADGLTYAAAFVLWDMHYMYFLFPAYDPAFKESGASALLVLEAMKLAREKHVRFDFNNSMDKRVLKEFKQFGAEPVRYYSVERTYKSFAAFLIRCALHFT